MFWVGPVVGPRKWAREIDEFVRDFDAVAQILKHGPPKTLSKNAWANFGPRGFMTQKLPNSVTCLTCMTTITSTYRHDYVCCACGVDSLTHVCVDGGHDYNKRGFGNRAKWREADGSVYGATLDAEATS